MSDIYRHKIRLSDGQKRKLRTAFRRRRSAVVGLRHENIAHGNDHILLDGIQHKAIEKALRNKTGIRLVLSYDQLLKNKEGGLLREMLELVEKTVPGGKRFISPLVRDHLAPTLKNKFIPWLKQLIDNELDTIIKKDPQGAGLKRRINSKLDSLLKKH